MLIYMYRGEHAGKLMEKKILCKCIKIFEYTAFYKCIFYKITTNILYLSYLVSIDLYLDRSINYCQTAMLDIWSDNTNKFTL